MRDTKRSLETLELVGGASCLDFANTINSRHEPEHDYLVSYVDLIEWAEKVGELSAQQAKKLKQLSTQSAAEAERIIKKGRNIRDVVYRVFSAVAGQSIPLPDDLKALARFYEEAIANGRFVKVENRYQINWDVGDRLEFPLWSITAAAEKLLTSDELKYVKECPGCGWLFLDSSKNQSRRWCSMDTCGARDKMRRYHGRLKKR